MLRHGKNIVLVFMGMFFTTSLYACGIFHSHQDETSGQMTEEEISVLETVIDNRVITPDQEKPDGEGKWGNDSATAVRKYTLYKEYYDQDNFKDAFGPWRWLLHNAPRVNEKLYIRGVNLVEYKIKNAGEETKKAWVDTLMMVYDQRIEYFDDEGENLGRKGGDLIKFEPTAYEEAFGILKRSVEIEGDDVLSSVPYYYVFSAVQMHRMKKLDKLQLLEIYDQTTGIITNNLNDDPDRWGRVQKLVDDLVSPYLTCEDLVGLFKERFESARDDVKSLEKISQLLDKKNCTEDPFYLIVSERLYELEPSAGAAYAIARGWEAKGNANKAIDFYQKALNQEEDPVQASNYALFIAQIYKDRGDLNSAQQFGRKAIGLNGQNGRAYLFLGDLYVFGAGQCGEGFDKQTVYWVAVDQYIKARNADPSVKADANKRINTYSAAFPTREKIFFHDLTVGDSYTVGCWINETTEVRASAE